MARRDGIAASAQSERVPSRPGSDLEDGTCGRQVPSQVAPREVVLELMQDEPRVLVLHAAVVRGCYVADVVSHASVSFLVGNIEVRPMSEAGERKNKPNEQANG